MRHGKQLDKGSMQQCGIRVAPLVRHAPCIVKPVRGVSSIGVQVCDTDTELDAILTDSKRDDTASLIRK